MSRFVRALAISAVLSSIAMAQPVWAEAADDAANALENLKPLAKNDLSKFAGGTALDNLNLATNTSTVTGNSIGNIGTSGAIGSNAVSGNSGLTTFIANSGNQVTISQSTVVNVYLH